MSLTLAEVVRRCPEAKVVLTGDVADELFAGYPSMRRGVRSRGAFVDRIREKLADLPLNDAARYTLASLHGCRTVLGYTRNAEAPHARIPWSASVGYCPFHSTPADHPIEVRTPFSSHHILEVLHEASADVLVGSIRGVFVSKFLLRVLGLYLGVPLAITIRAKVPFNHGGSGLSNDSRDCLETQAAKHWSPLREEQLCRMIIEEKSRLLQLGLAEEAVGTDQILENRFEQIVAYFAAKHAGLDRLISGGTFREKMPDTVYATDLKDDLYVPAQMMTFDVEQSELCHPSHQG
jgi:asparagine synthetase B (glutamine-hydrolysing)